MEIQKIKELTEALIAPIREASTSHTQSKLDEFEANMRALWILTNVFFKGNKEFAFAVSENFSDMHHLTADLKNSLERDPKERNKNWAEGYVKIENRLKNLLQLFDLVALTPPKIISQKPVTKAAKKIKMPAKINNQRVFVVHGHDDAMKESVARTLTQIGLEPIILHEKPNLGRTIIEKFSDYSDVGFAVVLLSGDDLAFPKASGAQAQRPRARQNVIFELGYFIGKLGKRHVMALYKEEPDFEIPSDYSGVVFTPFDSAGKWKFDLVKELKACDFKVDANRLIQ